MREAFDLMQNVRWKKWVVVRTQEERGSADRRQEAQRARAAVIVPGAFEPMHRCGDDVVELEERTGALERRGVEQVGISGQLPSSLRSQRAKEMPGVDASESP